MENGKKMEEILKAVGPAGATIEKEGQWDFAVYIEDEDDESILIEMCEKKDYKGDLIMDPYMRIYLEKDKDGHITQAIPKAYQSDSLVMGRTDINEKGEIFLNLKLMETKPGELDRRLESWLHSIDGIGISQSRIRLYFMSKFLCVPGGKLVRKRKRIWRALL